MAFDLSGLFSDSPLLSFFSSLKVNDFLKNAYYHNKALTEGMSYIKKKHDKVFLPMKAPFLEIVLD